MHFDFETQSATFLERPNRFRVEARLHASGELASAHCADPGRLRELLLPGVTIHISPATNPERKTAYDLRFVEHPEHGQLISLDTRLPNAIFAEGLVADSFAPFRGHQGFEREVTVPQQSSAGVRSRIDFRLEDRTGRTCWVEVKSATLVEAGVALFPDAPTARGRRHLLELQDLAEQGDRAAVVFIVQRPDAVRLSPNRVTDPDFAEMLAAVHEAGVEIYAHTCHLTTRGVTLGPSIPVDLTRF